MNIFIDDIVKATNGEIIKKENKEHILDICIDSRKVKEHDLFVALIGENFDAHKFIDDVYKKGCKSFLINDDYIVDDNYKNINIVRVKDTTKALADIATFYKSKFNIPYISITGSVGKTTTKDMIYSVLSEKYNTLKNEGNFNNHIGLPLTVFKLRKEHTCAILEMGMSSLGEIEYLSNIVKPNIGVISNIGYSHIENLGSRENILKAKLEITSNFNETNLLIVNGDDEYLKTLKNKDLNYRLKTFGFEENNDIFCYECKLTEDEIEFGVVIEKQKYKFFIKAKGKHNVYNAMSAILIGLEMNITIDEIRNGLLNFKSSKMRLDIVDKGDFKIINDAYNASLDSMKAALDILSEYKTFRKIAVLGDMLELGDYARAIHEEAGLYSLDKVDLLISVGNRSKYITDIAMLNGLKNVIHFDSNIEVIKYLKNIIKKDDIVLIKGSRGMKLEEVVEAL